MAFRVGLPDAASGVNQRRNWKTSRLSPSELASPLYGIEPGPPIVTIGGVLAARVVPCWVGFTACNQPPNVPADGRSGA